MDKYFYYVREFDNSPTITVAVGADEDGTICRGIALCSNRDQPCKAAGRVIAEHRLYKAFYNMEDSDPIRTFWRAPASLGKLLDDLDDDMLGDVFKSQYDVEATEFELGLLDRDFRTEEYCDDYDYTFKEDEYDEFGDGSEEIEDPFMWYASNGRL